MFVDGELVESCEKPRTFERIEGIETDFRDEVGTAFSNDDRDVVDVEEDDDVEKGDEDDAEDDCWVDPPPPR